MLGHRVMAPLTLGTFPRAFSFGHVRQLEAAVGQVLARAWELGAGPRDDRVLIDLRPFGFHSPAGQLRHRDHSQSPHRGLRSS